MTVESIKLNEIPTRLLPIITGQSKRNLWLNGNIVKEIYIIRDRYRVTTNRGQFRYSMDTDLVLNIV